MSTRAIFSRVGVGAIGPWIAAVVFILAAADISPVGAQSTETLRVSTLDETASSQIGVTPNQRYDPVVLHWQLLRYSHQGAVANAQQRTRSESIGDHTRRHVR